MPIIKDADHIDELRLIVPCHEYTVLVKQKQEIARNRKINPSKIENYLCKINNVTKDEIQFSYSEPEELKNVVVILFVNKKSYLNMKDLYYKKFKAKVKYTTIPEIGINTHYKNLLEKKEEKILTLNQINDNMLITIANKDNLLFSHSISMPKTTQEFIDVTCLQINNLLSDAKKEHAIEPEILAINFDNFSIDNSNCKGMLKKMNFVTSPIDVNEYRSDETHAAVILSALGIGGHDG